jgi:hypothetical protein
VRIRHHGGVPNLGGGELLVLVMLSVLLIPVLLFAVIFFAVRLGTRQKEPDRRR